METTRAADADELLEAAKGWWLYLVVGVLWILFGWIVLSFKFDTVWAVAVFFGIGFIIGGAMELFVGTQAEGWRWLYFLLGIIAILAGIAALIWPGQTFLVMAAIAGWYLLFVGMMDIVSAFVTREENDLWWLQLVLGITEVLIGFWAVGYAGRSIALLVIWVGAAALARGISSIIFGFGVHGAARELRKRVMTTRVTSAPPGPPPMAPPPPPPSAAVT